MSILDSAPVIGKRGRKGKAREFTCEMVDDGTIRVNGTTYGVETISPGEDGTAAIVLTKGDGDNYAVIRRHNGSIECSCPDFVCRCEGIHGALCKHARAALELGLLDPPSFADELAAAVGPIAPTADDLAEMHRCHVEMEAEALGIIPTEADPTDWPAWTDEDVWELDDDAPALLTLDQLIDHEANAYRRVGTLAGEMIGRHLSELASMVRFVRAATPGQAQDRLDALEAMQLRGE